MFGMQNKANWRWPPTRNHTRIIDYARDTFDDDAANARPGQRRQGVAAIIKSHELVPSATAVC